MSNEVTDSTYWDKYWGSSDELPHYDASRGLFYSYDLLLSSCIAQVRKRMDRNTLQVIDCGCGEGMMLRFLQERFSGLEIAGIDYSEAIRKAESMGRLLACSWDLVKWDMNIGMPPKFVDSFDIVLSFGLIEHFNDPVPMLRTMKSALRKGGCMITIIPNFIGLYHFLWRLYDRDNHKQHVPISPDHLAALHEQIGLEGIAIYQLGAPIIPGIHNANHGWEKLLQWVITQINGRILQRFAPRQTRLDKCYPLQPVLACVGVHR